MGRLAGVDIRADFSVLLIFLLIAVGLGTDVLPRWHPRWPLTLTWVIALLAASAFLVSIVAHELSHALVGRTQGVTVRQITLFMLGGIGHVENEPATPKAELLMAIAGPLTSFTIGFVSLVLGGLLAGDVMALALRSESPDLVMAAMRHAGPGATLLLWLGPLNIVLALFNLVPAFPLDGGRVLRSLLWAATGQFQRATHWATNVGRAFAWGLMGLGVVNLLAGQLAQGLWLLLLGGFLAHAARLSYERMIARSALEAVPIARVMRTDLERVPSTISLEDLVTDHLVISDQHLFPVESADGTLLGVISADEVRKVPPSRWTTTSVASVMTKLDALAGLPPQADAEDAFEQLVRTNREQLPVVEGKRVLGLVRKRDLLLWIALQRPGEQHA